MCQILVFNSKNEREHHVPFVDLNIPRTNAWKLLNMYGKKKIKFGKNRKFNVCSFAIVECHQRIKRRCQKIKENEDGDDISHVSK